jgi:hypothetical protein
MEIISFIEILLISSGMVFITCLIYYEVLHLTWDLMPKVRVVRHRAKVILIIFSMLFGHTVAVWLYAGAYWLLIHYFDYGTIVEMISGKSYDGSFRTLLYFSSITYSSLGYGELIPSGPIRIFAGIQVINGLMLIGWSVSFTFLAMERFWDIRVSSRPKSNNIKKKT